jgi:exopolysaccharide production protein ExoQ
MNQGVSLPLTSAFAQPAARTARLPQVAFGMFLLLVFVGLSPFVDSTKALANVEGEGNILRQIGFLAAGFLIFACYVQTCGFRPFKPVPLLTLLTLGWMAISIFWSASPEITLRRSILTGLVALSVFWSVAMLGPHKSLSVLRLVLAPVIVIDLLSVWIIPSASHAYEGQMVWAGMHGHKNVAGAIASLAGLLFFHCAVTRSSLADWFLLACAVVFLWGTASKTAIVLLTLMFISYVLYRCAQENALRRRLLIVGFWSAALSVSALLWIYWDDVTVFLEDPTIFTGRGRIWQVMLTVIPDHFWTGTGFGAFWQGEFSPVRPYVAESWILKINHAHNGYMEILATLGVIGLTLGLFAFVIAPVKQLLMFAVSRDNGALAFALIMFSTLGAITKGIFLDSDRPEWVIFVLALALLHQHELRPDRSLPPYQ